MLDYLIIKNYKSHKDTYIKFHSGINVFVGISNSGKSDILRAFLWVSTGRPLGFHFKSWFSKKEPTVVEIGKTTGYSIRKTKTKNQTKYEILYNGKLLSKFRKVGHKVPVEVQKILNISELNVQDQLNQFFLITSSPQEVARAINRIINIEDADDIWFPKLTTKINDTRRAIKNLEDEKTSLKAELVFFKDIKKWKSKRKTIVKLQRSLEECVLVEKTIVECIEIISVVDPLIEANEKLLVILKEKLTKSNIILSEMKDFEEHKKLLTKFTVAHENFAKYENLHIVEKFVMKIEHNYKVYESLRKQEEGILSYVTAIEKGNGRVVSLAKEKEKALQFLGNKLSDIGVCPICFTNLDEKQIKNMLELYDENYIT